MKFLELTLKMLITLGVCIAEIIIIVNGIMIMHYRSIIIATLLHDVVEDTHYSIADIQERFGGRVAELVSYETEDKRKGQKESDTWKIRKEEFLEHLSRCPIEAKMITIGDKVSNLRAMKKDYENLGEKLWERFNQKNPVEQGWYYISIKNMTKELQDYSAWCEYEKLCGELFGFMESL